MDQRKTCGTLFSYALVCLKRATLQRYSAGIDGPNRTRQRELDIFSWKPMVVRLPAKTTRASMIGTTHLTYTEPLIITKTYYRARVSRVRHKTSIATASRNNQQEQLFGGIAIETGNQRLSRCTVFRYRQLGPYRSTR